MGVDILIKEADGLSEDKIAEVVSFVAVHLMKNPKLTFLFFVIILFSLLRIRPDLL